MPRGIAVRCLTCPCELTDPAFEPAGLTTGEKADYLLRLAETHKWLARNNDGNLELTCPACLKQRAVAEHGPFPPHDPKAKCPKCGFNRVATRYCTGLSVTCPIGAEREHLHRACGRCAFDWREACKDHQPRPVGHRNGNELFPAERTEVVVAARG